MRIAACMFIGLVLFFACKKEDTHKENQTTRYQCKAFTDDQYLASSNQHFYIHTSLTFDNLGRPTLIQNDRDSVDKYMYTYTSANSFEERRFSGTHQTLQLLYALNSKGNIDSFVSINGSGDAVMVMRFTYNSQNLLSSISRFDKSGGQWIPNGVTNYEYDVAGDMTQVDGMGSTVTYSYDATRLNLLAPIYPYTTTSPYLLKTHTQLIPGPMGPYFHTYSLDNIGRVISDTSRLESSQDYFARTYEY